MEWWATRQSDLFITPSSALECGPSHRPQGSPEAETYLDDPTATQGRQPDDDDAACRSDGKGDLKRGRFVLGLE